MSRVLSIPQAVMDYRLIQAMNEIRENSEDTVDVVSKAKSLSKFGRTAAVGTSFETVWEYGGDETYATTNAIDTISSSSASDTDVDITVEGHTVSGTGADAQYTFVIQTVNTNGQSKVLLPTPLARTARQYVSGATAAVGDIYVYEDDTLTGGVPNTAAKVHNVILGAAGNTQSYKAATTFSNTDYFICTSGWASVSRNAGNVNVDLELQVKPAGGVFRPVAARISLGTQGSQTVQIFFDPYVIVPKNADIRVVAEASASAEVHTNFNGYLAQVVS